MTNENSRHLNNHHRDTLMRIFQHPTSHNIDWRDVVSLLEAVGTVEEPHEGKYRVEVGLAVAFLERPKGKDVDVQMIVDLRHLLTDAGYHDLVEDLEAKGHED